MFHISDTDEPVLRTGFGTWLVQTTCCIQIVDTKYRQTISGQSIPVKSTAD